MRDDELDRILSAETDIVPSSGFAGTVMDAVRLEALAPPPIPFPWKRALPGLAAWGLALMLVLTMVRSTPALPNRAWLPSALATLLTGTQVFGVGWIVLALLLSIVSVKVSMRLARGSAP